MSGQKGQDILLKVSNTAGGYDTLAGIRSRKIKLNTALVDGTSSDSPEGWRELVAGAGVKTLQVSGSGVFKDAPSDARMREMFFAGLVEMWQLVLPDFGRFVGLFQITELSWAGEHNGEATFNLTLESAGHIRFEAAS